MQPKRSAAPALVFALCLGSSLASAQPAPQLAAAPVPTVGIDRGPFGQGRVGLSLWAGTTFSGHDAYLKLGASAGVYLIDGLRLGVGGQFWLFNDPFVATLTPELTYVFYFVNVVKPYVGAFYSHYFVGSNITDFDSVGARAGIYILPRNVHLYFGGGLVYERLLDCNTDIVSCNDVYPELIFALVL